MKAELVRVVAGDGLELVGLYAAPPGATAKRAILHTHGLAGNFYENRFIADICDAVLAKGVAFLVTNNRGHDYRSDNLKGRGLETSYQAGGSTLDIIEDCVHDIAGGAAFLAERGHQEIYFEGHSLGCSKTVYYLTEVGHPGCAGLILISPPEMFGLQEDRVDADLSEALARGRALMQEGRGDQLLEVGRDVPYSAATFVSMFGDPAVTDIFPFRQGAAGDYSRLASLSSPILVTYGDVEEAVNVPVEEAASLIEKMATSAATVESVIVRGANHAYWGHEDELASAIAAFVETVGSSIGTERRVKTLIQGGRLVTEIDSYHADLLVEDGKIAAIGKGLAPPDGAEVYDASGKLVMPGVIDSHVHVSLDLDGHVSSDFASTTRAAAFGGVTTILTYATPRKGQLLSEVVEERKAQADGNCYVDFGLHAVLANWDDRRDTDIQDMIEAGLPSFKMYTAYSASGLKSTDEQIYAALLEAGRRGGLIEVHCENEWIIERKIKRLVEEGKLSASDHAASRPSYVEGEAVATLLRAAYEAGAPVYVVHASTAEAVDAIDEAIELGLEVYGETCPHFLLLDERKLSGPDGHRYATCPPLRAEDHQAYLWGALDDGQIHVIATDHAEFTAADKDAGASDFRRIPMGLPGVGTLLPLMWHFGVSDGRMQERDLVDRLCTQPAEIFGLYPEKGNLALESDADIVVFDPDLRVTITPEVLHGHADYSPYDGCEVTGWPVSTMLRG